LSDFDVILHGIMRLSWCCMSNKRSPLFHIAITEPTLPKAKLPRKIFVHHSQNCTLSVELYQMFVTKLLESGRSHVLAYLGS